MRITEQMLLDGYDGIAKGGTLISVVTGTQIHWCYRKGNDDEGWSVTDRSQAGTITLEYDRGGHVAIDDDCAEHVALARITSDEERLFGVEV